MSLAGLLVDKARKNAVLQRCSCGWPLLFGRWDWGRCAFTLAGAEVFCGQRKKIRGKSWESANTSCRACRARCSSGASARAGGSGVAHRNQAGRLAGHKDPAGVPKVGRRSASCGTALVDHVRVTAGVSAGRSIFGWEVPPA